MSGFTAFARKEAREIVRTWRIWVLPGMFLFFALTGPVLARFTPELVRSLAGDELGGITLPEPTYRDAYAQWTKNLLQLIMFALIIVYAGIVSAERRGGTAVLVLTKPLSRDAFLGAKITVHSAFVSLLVLLGAAVTWAGTALVFGQAPAGPVWSSSLVCLVFGALFISLMTVLSVAIDSTAGSAGAGIAVYAVLSIAGIWSPLGTYSPAGLPSAAAALAVGQDATVLWPVVTSVLLTAALAVLAALVFRRKEL